MPDPLRVAVVTGANRGLGLEVSRQLAYLGYRVVLGSRDLAKGAQAAATFAEAGLDVTPVELDVTEPATLTRLAGRLEAEAGHVDVLVNNAAIHYDSWQQAAAADLNVVREAIETNLIGAWQTTLALIQLIRRSGHGRIVNVSSGAGALEDMGGGAPAYKVSKTSLNALTRMLAAELKRDGILVNSVCPGWVATDMGGSGGRPIPDGAAGIVWAATLPDEGPSGAISGRAVDGRPKLHDAIGAAAQPRPACQYASNRSRNALGFSAYRAAPRRRAAFCSPVRRSWINAINIQRSRSSLQDSGCSMMVSASTARS